MGASGEWGELAEAEESWLSMHAGQVPVFTCLDLAPRLYGKEQRITHKTNIQTNKRKKVILNYNKFYKLQTE